MRKRCGAKCNNWVIHLGKPPLRGSISTPKPTALGATTVALTRRRGAASQALGICLGCTSWRLPSRGSALRAPGNWRGSRAMARQAPSNWRAIWGNLSANSTVARLEEREMHRRCRLQPHPRPLNFSLNLNHLHRRLLPRLRLLLQLLLLLRLLPPFHHHRLPHLLCRRPPKYPWYPLHHPRLLQRSMPLLEVQPTPRVDPQRAV